MIKGGANVDAVDDKDVTPLYIGIIASTNTSKILLLFTYFSTKRLKFHFNVITVRSGYENFGDVT